MCAGNDPAGSFASAMHELGFVAALKSANIRRTSRNWDGKNDSEKRSAMGMLTHFLVVIFSAGNFFQFLSSKRGDEAASKSTSYRFLEDEHFNWRKLVTCIAYNAITLISRLTSPSRVKCFVLDDSVIPRNKSKKVELLSWIYDHVNSKSVKGFDLLLLGWTDGFSFIPVAFNMIIMSRLVMTEEQKSDRQKAREKIDKRTNGYKARQDGMLSKPDAAIKMLESALAMGITASYVLMDTWFTNEPFIKRICALGLDVIGMVKDNKQQYWYKGKLYGLKDLYRIASNKRTDEIWGSIVVATKYSKIRVKLVFVRNRNSHDKYVVLLSTDTELSDREIIRIYGNRWSIECCFKACKSLLQLGKENKGLSYDLTISTTALAILRFTILEWIRRKENDQKTFGEIFRVCLDDIADMDLTTALRDLMEIISTGVKDGSVSLSASARAKLVSWYLSQPHFIQALFPDFMAEVPEELKEALAVAG